MALAGKPLVLSPPPRRGRYARLKPALDFALALALTPFALLAVALAALAVKLTSSGPAFYAQTRVGRDGRRFTLVKLRTMRHRCETLSGPRWSQHGDDRVTRLGRFLRASHLDELPQLWNVLRGDMSLVGPRPERPEIIESQSLARLVPGYDERVSVEPGITGLAQLLLPPDSDVESVRRKLAYDLWYVENCGPWLDLRILCGTLLKLAGLDPRLPRRAAALEGLPPAARDREGVASS
jgi:lipopolysaccharide/colanic/teichoic acid biosynthesis glycosyltransferase